MIEQQKAAVLPETWRPIPDYERMYEVSSIGRVRSLERLNSRGHRQPPRMMKAPIDGAGYRAVNLCRGGTPVKIRVHVLVCLAFNSARPDIPHAQVRHLDGDTLNNCADNLQWGTYADQREDDLKNGANWQRRKTHCPKGHEYTPENTYSPPARPNSRYCRKCNRERHL